nr:DJ-1/PfpI family protein [uncultured Holophaga sp.]
MSHQTFRAAVLAAGLAAAAQAAAPHHAILLAVTSHDRMGSTADVTGAYLSEVTHAYYVFLKAGYRVDFVSPKGGHVPLDGLKDADPDNKAFLADAEAQRHLHASLKASEVKPGAYDAIYFAGGHGVMWDFPDDAALQGLTRAIYEQGGVVGAVCHGPAALVNVKLSDGRYLVAGRKVAGFTNAEETRVGRSAVVPFLLESRLRERGAQVSTAPLFQPHVEVSGRLVTGQNPASARGVATELVNTLRTHPFPHQEKTMNAIVWPEAYLPGTTDNYCSNEIIVKGLSAAQIWAQLNDTTLWPSYYSNASDIRFHDGSGPKLSLGARFRFTTFGFLVEGEVTEYVPPVAGHPARVAWHGWVEGDAQHRLDVHHAWLFEDLEGGRVRILTQESQTGKPAQDLATAKPNPMINAHQEWIEGLARAAKAAK